MRKSIYTYAIALALPIVALMTTSCEPKALGPEDVLFTEQQIQEVTADGKIYTLDEFLEKFSTPAGNHLSDTTLYRTRANDKNFPDIWLFSLDTIPTEGEGIYIRGRVSTDDYAGNFYKALVIQQVVGLEQQNLRISVDLGSSGGLFQIGQEILIRCNGLAIGRYANQPQLCIPTYNNNINASSASEKVGWAPGRIPGSVFRKATKLIGTPQPKKLFYMEFTSIQDLYDFVGGQSPEVSLEGMTKVRKMDGLLVRLKGVHFNGKYNKYGDMLNCVVGDPEIMPDSVNVFAPTTANVGYPQSRFVEDQAGKVILCSSSEYAKFAHYYLPGAGKDGIENCKYFEGDVTGILGWYADDAKRLPGSSYTGSSEADKKKSYQYNWSITPRGIPGFGIEDIIMADQREAQPVPWVPKEYDPNDK